MLSEDVIRKALHAERVVPLSTANPHGPFGLEQVAAEVSAINPTLSSREPGVQWPITVDTETWDQLNQLAEATTSNCSHPVTPQQVAGVILKQAVADLVIQSDSPE